MPYPCRKRDLTRYARDMGNGVRAIGSRSVESRMAAAESQPHVAQTPPHGNVTIHMAEPKPKHDTLPDIAKRSLKIAEKTEVAPEEPNTTDPLRSSYRSPAMIPTRRTDDG